MNGMTAIQELTQLALTAKKERYGNIPSYALVNPRFDDLTANGLTQAVITWLNLKGHYCSRIQSQGQWRMNLGRFTRSTTRKGIGDITAIIGGRSVMIEIKIGRDKLSPAQIKTAEDVERSGGLYWVVKSMDQFRELYNQLVQQQSKQV